MNYCNCPNCRTENCPNAHDADRINEFEASLDLIHDADMRGIELWRQESPTERELIQPDRAQMIFWLLKKIDEKAAANSELEAALATARREARETTAQAFDAMPMNTVYTAQQVAKCLRALTNEEANHSSTIYSIRSGRIWKLA